MKKEKEIRLANGKLGVLTPGMGAVSTTMVAGVYASKERTGKAHWLADADGNHPAGKKTGKAHPADQGFRPTIRY